MKRFLVIPVMFLYILAVSGVMVHAHYCGQVLESWMVYQKAAGCDDGGCGDETEAPDSCCEDKVVTFKVSYDQNHVDALKLKLSAPAVALVQGQIYPPYSQNVLNCTAGTHTYHANAPPGLWESIPLYKLHSSFTYYG